LLALIVIVSGCFTARFEVIDPSTPFELAEHEGLLLFQIDSELPIDQIEWSGLFSNKPIRVGETFWVVRVTAGRYSWSSLRVSAGNSYAGRYRIQKSNYANPSELEFELVQGKLNYAGKLIVSKVNRNGFRSFITIRLRNHIAHALRETEKRHPDLFDRYAFHQALITDDEFLEFYLSERERVAKSVASSSPTTSDSTLAPSEVDPQ